MVKFLPWRPQSADRQRICSNLPLCTYAAAAQTAHLQRGSADRSPAERHPPSPPGQDPHALMFPLNAAPVHQGRPLLAPRPSTNQKHIWLLGYFCGGWICSLSKRAKEHNKINKSLLVESLLERILTTRNVHITANLTENTTIAVIIALNLLHSSRENKKSWNCIISSWNWKLIWIHFWRSLEDKVALNSLMFYPKRLKWSSLSCVLPFSQSSFESSTIMRLHKNTSIESFEFQMKDALKRCPLNKEFRGHTFCIPLRKEGKGK